MRKILVPIDGSQSSLSAINALLGRTFHEGEVEIHLLNVQYPVDSGHARMFVSKEELNDYHKAEGLAALEEAGKILDDARIAYSRHVLVGHISETIIRFAREKRFDEIVMGTHGRSALTHLLLGSIASEVVRMSHLPVMLIR